MTHTNERGKVVLFGKARVIIVLVSFLFLSYLLGGRSSWFEWVAKSQTLYVIVNFTTPSFLGTFTREKG